MSFRTRLFGTYTLVIVICLAIVGITTTALLQGYRDRLTMDRLDNIARPVAVQVRSLTTSQLTADRLWTTLEDQARENNVYILLVRSDGSIVRQITPSASQEQLSVRPRLLPRDLSSASQGRFTTADGRVYIYAAYPLARLPVAVAASTETLVLAVPRAGSLAILAGMAMPLTIGGIVALVISLIVSIVFARSVSRPLNRVKEAAGKIAGGDYEHRVPEEGTREMRDLAISFNHMADKVKHSQQQLRHFVADVSHELKNPLTSIQGFSQALVDGTAADEETLSKAAGIINSESRRMRRQVDELLDLSRMQSGQFRMAHDLVDIADIIARCHDVFDLQAREKGVRLIRRTGGPLTTTGDADRLEQLFSNLLDNAIKNTQSGGQVTITGTPTGDAIEVTVVDNGPGIPADQLPYVFERFYQITGLRTGVGLGLAIAKEIAFAHGGTIDARSQPGEGAEFVVRIPAAQPDNGQ